MKSSRTLWSVLIATVMLVGVVGSPALAQPFTFQGKLTSGGSPANGSYDLRFRLYDHVTGAAQVGSQIAQSGVAVSDGIFTITALDFGAASFPGADRWIEVDASPAGTGNFTTLAPRTKLTPTPYAIRALNEWLAPDGIRMLHNDATTTGLLLNRANRITGAEYFGFTAPVGAGLYGGMYIDTASPTGLPFYGYSVGGGIQGCWTYFDPTASQWIVYNGGPQLVVQSDGKVGIGTTPTQALDVSGNVLATNFQYRAPVTHYYSVPPEDFHPASTADVGVSGTGQGLAFMQSGTGSMVTGIHLPDGAVVTAMDVYYYNNTASQMQVIFFKTTLAGLAYSQTALTPALTGPNASVRTASVPINPPLVIDNSTTSYQLNAYSTDWASFNMGVRGVRLTYTVTSPQ